MKKFLKYATKVILSGILSVLLLSLFALVYDNTPIGIEQPSGITNLRFEPNTWWSYMKEGFAFGRINNIGYNSYDDFAEDGEALIAFLGSSHTEALQIKQEDTYVSLVQSRLHGDPIESNNFQCMNFGLSAHFLNVTVSNFDVFVNAFDDIALVVIEAENIAYSTDELQKMLVNAYRNPLTNKSLPEKILQKIPYIRSLKRHVEKLIMQNDTELSSAPIDFSSYAEGMDLVLAKVSSLAALKGVPVIIVYHSPFEISEQEGLIRTDNQQLVDIFEKICERQGISFLDVSDTCIEHYRSTFETPAGFSNTFMGFGHLNKTGHKIVADAIYQKICELTTGEANGF